MSYTLKGRIETRLAASAVPLLVACVLSAALGRYWPLELAGLMIGLGLALDAVVYDRLLPYHPGWLAVPLGVLELGAVMGLARAFEVPAPLAPAVWFYAGSWLVAQVLVQAGFPLLRVSYGEDGGELGRAGALAGGAVLAVFAATGGIAWANLPPTVRLSAGVHRGPLVIDSREILVGAPGAVVQGGIVVKADGVNIRNVTVRGGENGIVVDEATGVVLDHVTVEGAVLDGIHVRRGSVKVRNCRIRRLRSRYAQGIDISFSMDKPPSIVEGCSIKGGQEGIVADSTMAEVRDNHVSGTSLRAITMTEMSMGTVDDNRVHDALGIGILCSDRSECEISNNDVAGTRPDRASGDGMRMGYGIVVHFGSRAFVKGNTVAPAGRGIAAFFNSAVEHD